MSKLTNLRIPFGLAMVWLISGATALCAELAVFKDGAESPFVAEIYAGTEDTRLGTNNGGFSDQNFGGRLNFDVGERIPGGSNHFRRGLVRFDLSSMAGRYSTVNSVTLRLFITHYDALNGSDIEGSDVLQVFRLSDANAGWIEGTEIGAPAGSTPDVGMTTWNQRVQGSQNWAGSAGAGVAGVDYLPAVLGSLPFNSADEPAIEGTYVDIILNDTTLIDDWAYGTNAGLILRTQTENNASISFFSSDATDPAVRPELRIVYTPVPSPIVYHSSYTGSGTPPWNRLDTGKTFVKEGTDPQLLTYDNLINTAQGLNGIVFDIENLPDAGNLSVEDFEFQVSPQGAFVADDHPPANWQEAPDPSSINVTPGSPDRVLIQWPDQSIMNRWLRITVLATEETGLAEPETYYIGHLLGETTGPTDGTFTVSFADITPIRAEVGQTVDASSVTDIDKNGTVSFADISAMRGNVGAQLTQISVP